jgi:hypothetical protein
VRAAVEGAGEVRGAAGAAAGAGAGAAGAAGAGVDAAEAARGGDPTASAAAAITVARKARQRQGIARLLDRDSAARTVCGSTEGLLADLSVAGAR